MSTLTVSPLGNTRYPITAAPAQPAVYTPYQPLGNGSALTEGSPAPSTGARLIQPDRLRILYTNDTHEKYQSMPGLITGFNLYRQQARKAGIDSFTAGIGDENIGNQRNELDLNVQLNNLMQLDAATLGNHEFDAGDDALSEALRGAKYTTLASNLLIPPSSPLYQRLQDGTLQTNSQILVTRNGERLGLVGITVPDTWQYLNPDAPMHDVMSMTFEDSLTKLQGDVNQLRQRGVNRILLLSHAGYDKDLQIARRVSGIDVILGGHTHTELNGVQPGVNYVLSPSGEPVMIAQTGKDAKAFGVLDLQWDPAGRVIPLGNTLMDPRTFAPDPQARAAIDAVEGPEHVIGTVPNTVSTDGAATDGENGVANKVADAIRSQTGADIGFFRSTELRNNLYPGPFSDRDIHILLPFADPLVAVDMTGSQIWDALNESARAIQGHNAHPGLIVGSGLRYSVDASQGKAIGALVYSRQTNQWEPLDFNKHYSVAMGDFILKNKTEYPGFKTSLVIQQYPFTARDAFGQWIFAQQGKPLQFPTDGRLQVIRPFTPVDNPLDTGLVTNPFSQPLPMLK